MKGWKKGAGELESNPQQTETIFELAVDVRALGERLQGGADQKIFQTLSPVNERREIAKSDIRPWWPSGLERVSNSSGHSLEAPV